MKHLGVVVTSLLSYKCEASSQNNLMICSLSKADRVLWNQNQCKTQALLYVAIKKLTSVIIEKQFLNFSAI